MKIDTDFNVYDTVFFMKENKVQESTIVAIEAREQIKDTSLQTINTYITYYVNDEGRMLVGDLFTTKQELLNSL